MDLSKYPEFLDEFLKRIDALGIDVSDLQMDHVAVKTATVQEFLDLKPEFAKIGTLVHENIVRGRNVDIYKLSPPWNYRQYTILAIELISPIEGVDKLNTGFEHAEFVLKDGFENFLAKYSDLPWDKSIMNASEFPMIKLKLGDDMQVKFHLENILDIIGNNT